MAICLLGLSACSNDPVDAPPPPSEGPKKLELRIDGQSFNSFSYTITVGKDGDNYLHTVYEKSFYDGVVGVFYQPGDLLKKDV